MNKYYIKNNKVEKKSKKYARKKADEINEENEPLHSTIEFVPDDGSYDMPDPDLVDYYRDDYNRIICINSEIKQDDMFKFTRKIIEWNREDEADDIPIKNRRVITVLINSYGGMIGAAYMFVDIISKSKTPVRTVNLSSALSCGAVILLSGTKGYRYCTSLSTALIHEGSAEGYVSETYEQSQARSVDYKHTIDTMKQWIINHTKINTKTMNKWANKEIYLYAEDQVKYGLVDYILEDITQIL